MAPRSIAASSTSGFSAATRERIYRELRVDRIWEGTSEIQRLIIANELIKRGTGALALPTH
ncbi:acyl-CoA dehydrogenase family protein [Streptomyces sp. NPDC086549]|uniref:acyl-CoA dehydrogenase family protein n=1 Tax=Streptomyces sp. NPDC086549 TaxID=3365752 RepID=UPI00381A9439